MSYTVKMYRGNYYDRQMAANQDNAIVYVEHHFNSCGAIGANYNVVIVGSNASRTSIEMADRYSDLIEERFGVKQWDGNYSDSIDGVLPGGFGGRGNYNLKFTSMPSMLVEPLFVSCKEGASIASSHSGRSILAEVLAQTIEEAFPEGGLVAFSVGHKYKRTRPADRGASVYGEDPCPTDSLGHNEADYAEDVLIKTAELLESL